MQAVELQRRVGELDTIIAAQRAARQSVRVDALLQEKQELQARVKELSSRRKANQMKLKEVGLFKGQAERSAQAAAKQRSRLDDFWASEKETDRALEKVQAELAAAQKSCEEQRQMLKEQQEEITRLKAIAEPGKERFKTKGHFSAAVDLSIVQVLTLGIARKKVPQLYGIFARLFGIKLPGREIKVPGPVVDGKRTFVTHFVYHTPGATHCKEMAGVMYQINKLQARSPSPLAPLIPIHHPPLMLSSCTAADDCTAAGRGVAHLYLSLALPAPEHHPDHLPLLLPRSASGCWST